MKTLNLPERLSFFVTPKGAIFMMWWSVAAAAIQLANTVVYAAFGQGTFDYVYAALSAAAAFYFLYFAKKLRPDCVEYAMYDLYMAYVDYQRHPDDERKENVMLKLCTYEAAKITKAIGHPYAKLTRSELIKGEDTEGEEWKEQ